MKKQTYIYIQEPCHENWSNMSSEEQGRFCHSCSKTVTDFTEKTDTEILEYLYGASGSTCGRFATDQLNREIHVPATAAKKTFWAYLLSMFLPIMTAGRLNAQKKAPAKPQTEQNVVSKPGRAPLPVFSGMVLQEATSSDTTRLVDSTKTGAIAEQEGDAYTHVTMGLIIQYDKVKTVDTVSTIVKKATKNELFKIYPNPAVKGKKASIQVNKAGEYTLQLLDADSKMILLKMVTVSTKGQMVFLDIPSEIASGSYYLRLVQAGSNTQFVDKLVVK